MLSTVHGYLSRCLALVLYASGLSNASQLYAEVDLPAFNIKSLSCRESPDDSELAMDGSVTWIPTHRFVPATFHKRTTREDAHGLPVTLIAMRQEPTTTPRGLVIIITGGVLEAGIYSRDKRQISQSGGNFLIRSSHYFVKRGYRVVVFNRPGDYPRYGATEDTPFRYDDYRTSMAHATDIARIIQEHAVSNAPVILAGSSRGTISVFAQQTLANAMLLSSPITSGNGIVLGSRALPAYRASRAAVILSHQQDSCTASNPQQSIRLAETLHTHVPVAALSINGGIRDSLRDDPCAAFDYHGFTGIENCALTNALDALESLLAPVARLDVVADMNILLESTERHSRLVVPHDESRHNRFALPGNVSVLGGKVRIDTSSGEITYERPADIENVTDNIVYTISDGQGEITLGVINFNLQ